MGIFDGINVAESAMAVHRFRSEVAGENLANVHTAGYQRKDVELRANDFGTALEGALSSGSSGGGPTGASSVGGADAAGAVEVAKVTRAKGSPFDERQDAFLGVTEMMRSKSAFELNVRAATMLKSMALSSLEIGRGA